MSNNRKGRKAFLALGSFIATTAYILALMVLAGSGFVLLSSTTKPMTTFAQEGNDTTNTADTTPSNTTATITIPFSPSSGIGLSQQPIYQERIRTINETTINQTHLSITYSGNGTLTLPNNNTAARINTSSNGSALVSLMTQFAQGQEIFKTEEDGEAATATFSEIVQVNPATGGQNKAIVIAVVHTNSTGILAPLNDMIVAGIHDFQPNGDSLITLWRWEIELRNSDIGPVQEESAMYTTTTSELPQLTNMP
jgi:hypothetical protein